MEKKAVITILGMIKHTKWDKMTEQMVIKDESDKATYELEKKLSAKFTLSKPKHINMLPVVCDMFHDYTIVPLYTEDAKDIQLEVLKYEKINDDFLVNSQDGFIKDEEEFRDIFAKINHILGQYDKVIVDITHGFRHLPILMIINLIITNIQNLGKIEHLIFAKEEKKNTEYMIIDLKEYLDISNIALVIQSFLSTLKVPLIDMELPLYHYLNDFSIHLTSNQFHEIFSKDIINLKNEIKNKKDKELFFVKNLLKRLERFLDDIQEIEKKTYHEKFSFFSTLFVEKEYLLQASTYLIEAITHYLADELAKQKLINFDISLYENQQKLVALLKLNHNPKDFTFPHPYFVDINIETFNKLSILRDDVAGIRNKLAHINVQKSNENLKEELKSYIQLFASYTSENMLAKLTYDSSDKTCTVSYILQQYEKKTKEFSLHNTTPAKLKTIIEKYYDGKLDKLTNMDTQKLENFCKQYVDNIGKLFTLQKEKKLMLNHQEAKNLAPNK